MAGRSLHGRTVCGYLVTPLGAANMPVEPKVVLIGWLNADGSADSFLGNSGLLDLNELSGNMPLETWIDFGGMQLDPNGELRLTLSGQRVAGAYTCLVHRDSSDADGDCHGPDLVFEFGYHANNSGAKAGGDVLFFSAPCGSLVNIAGVLSGCTTDNAIRATR